MLGSPSNRGQNTSQNRLAKYKMPEKSKSKPTDSEETSESGSMPPQPSTATVKLAALTQAENRRIADVMVGYFVVCLTHQKYAFACSTGKSTTTRDEPAPEDISKKFSQVYQKTVSRLTNYSSMLLFYSSFVSHARF